jgi:ubiquinone/menaquinone biosynthesis C-methylase UbiE
MSTFHFVDDYEHHVDQLIRNHPLAEAMSLAVGGYYEEFSVILAEVLVQNGLRDGMTLVDLGCGSGRAAKGISKRVQIEYLGTDVVQRLLDYAAKVCPKHYRYKCHRELSVPAPDSSADMVCAFSLFTHLLHEESYIYLQESHRVLKPGGKFVMSFLEFASPSHWAIFQPTMEARRHNARQPLNMFIERNVIDVWCGHLGFVRESFVDGTDPRWQGSALGQSLAVLRKPA